MYPNESFFLSSSSPNKADSDTCLDGFDVVDSCDRQASFLWQVSGPNFHNDAFLRQGVENYMKFVRLMGTTVKAGTNDSDIIGTDSDTDNSTDSKKQKKVRPQFIVPTYQIDLMWHTHMLFSIAKYHEDNIRLNGCTLEHDDSLNDRSEGGKLDTNFQATRKLWRDIYGVEYKVPGGMVCLWYYYWYLPKALGLFAG